MFAQLVWAGSLIATTVVVQSMFMSVGLGMLKSMEDGRHPLLRRRPTLVVVLWVLFITIPVAIDVVLWAMLFLFKGALPSLEEALYFSTVTFTTVGYGDIVLGRGQRLLATCEAVNGVIIFGWTTALLMIVIQLLYLPGSAGTSR